MRFARCIHWVLADSECQANQFADLRQMKSLQPCEVMAAKIKQMARFELIHTANTHFGYFNDLSGYF
jgi:hypothetical protein